MCLYPPSAEIHLAFPRSLSTHVLATEVVPYETVVKELERDTINTSASLGHGGKRFTCGKFPSAVFITLKVGYN